MKTYTMKILLRAVLLLMIGVMVGSCSKDKNQVPDTPMSFQGTTWKCSAGLDWNENLEYLTLKFTSSTAVEGWSKYKDTALQRDWIGTYLITGDTIRMDEGVNGEKLTGTMSGINMIVTNEGETDYLTFTLQ